MSGRNGAFIAWTFHDRLGDPIFQHCRITTDDGRGKSYPYRFPWVEGLHIPSWGWVWKKHPLADRLLYRLPHVLRHPELTVVLTEGERDADEFVQRRVLVSSHHGGAGKFTEAQAESMAGHRGDIVLVADRDLPGAADVVRRYDLLRAVGIRKRRLIILRPKTPWESDARDHFEAGYGLDDFRRVDLGRVRAAAERASAEAINRYTADRLTDDELAEFRKHGWHPQVVDRARS